MVNKIPVVNERIEYENICFTITDADERRISRLEVLVATEEKGKGTKKEEG